MKQYSAQVVTDDSAASEHIQFEAVDDEEAARVGVQLSSGRREIRIWAGDRLVITAPAVSARNAQVS